MATYRYSAKLGYCVDSDGNPMNPDKSSWVPEAPVVMNDIEEFRSPRDGTMISSRSALREHEQKYGIRQVGTDFKGSMEKVQQTHDERQKYGFGNWA